MKNTKGMLSFHEWEERCKEGEGQELDFQDFPRFINLGCPNETREIGHGESKRCGAKLFDKEETCWTDDKPKRRVECLVCLWQGLRSLGEGSWK